MAVLDFDNPVELPPALTCILKKLNYNLICFPNSLVGAAVKVILRTCPRVISKTHKARSSQVESTTPGGNAGSKKGLKPGEALVLSEQIQPSLDSKGTLAFLRAPVSKGYNCSTHKGSVLGCATFFEHKNYEYKLLCHGELYFRPKGTHTFRTGPIVPKEPGLLFVVKLDNSGSNIIVFCFEPNSRTLGEVNGYAEFLPIQTSIASNQEAHGLVYVQGQGCVFDWVYGTRSSAQHTWNYDLRYDIGWMHSNPATEEVFASIDGLLAEYRPPFANSCNPLRHSLEGLDSVAKFSAPDALGEIQVGFAHIELASGTQPTEETQLSSSSNHPTIPTPLGPSHQSGASASTSIPTTSRSILRRTCNICGRVLRRPSALTIHMNAHYGIKPFQCNDCDYSSTNITNLQRHQQTRHPSSSNGGN